MEITGKVKESPMSCRPWRAKGYSRSLYLKIASLVDSLVDLYLDSSHEPSEREGLVFAISPDATVTLATLLSSLAPVR